MLHDSFVSGHDGQNGYIQRNTVIHPFLTESRQHQWLSENGGSYRSISLETAILKVDMSDIDWLSLFSSPNLQ